MSANLPMENRRLRPVLTGTRQAGRTPANPRQDNVFSIQPDSNGIGDGSLSALSYAMTPRRTQVVVVEGVRARLRAASTAHSDSLITNFNILVGRKMGIAHLRHWSVGGQRG